ncbi:MAG: WYL domain-containing protein [Gemmatimonadaceae bacterium]|nr:WYL domain-containing protein [Gemmatimonadaceae bacterium]
MTEVARQSLQALRGALKTSRKARLQYQSFSATSASARTVHPFGLVLVRGMWYLVAHCERVRALRIFRLDRMVSVRVLASPSAKRGDEELRATLERGRAIVKGATERLRVRYSRKVAPWIREDFDVLEQEDGSVVVEHPLRDDAWALRHVMAYGPDALVIEPTRIRDEVACRFKAIARPRPRAAKRRSS